MAERSQGAARTVRDAAATTGRILEAACEEFSRRGLAGARVERIATAAGSNVRMIYAYFGGKDALFDAAFEHLVQAMNTEVPPDGADLPGWAARLVEFHERDPRALRVSLWAQLERPEATAEPLAVYAGKVAALDLPASSAPLNAADVLTIVYAIAQSWHLTPTGLTDLGSTSTSERADAARTAVARLLGDQKQ